MQVKTCAATIKAAGPEQQLDEGVVEAIVATYDVDSVGDRIIPGAFAETIKSFEDAGRPIPFVWSHKSDDPEYHIGYVEKAEERPGQGLWVRARIDMDEPKAAKAYKLMKGRRVTQFSFSYDEEDARPAAKDDSGARKDLHRLKVYEVGPTLVGCNQSTSLIAAKQDQFVAEMQAGESVLVPRLAQQVGEKSILAAEAASEDTLAAALMKAGWMPPVPPAVAAACDASEKAVDDLAVQVKAAPGGFTPKPIVARIRRLQAAVQALLDAVEPNSDDSKAMPAEPADTPAPAAKGDVPAEPGTAAARRLPQDLEFQLQMLELEVNDAA